jgi:cell wall-associated NlpC family hydrolase
MLGRRGLWLATCLLALSAQPAVAGPLGELHSSTGKVVGQLPARSGASLGRNAVQVGSTRITSSAVELRRVRLLGGQIRVARLVVPRGGVAGAVIEGLRVGGRAVSAAPNTVVPLGGASYLIALQEAVTPGVGTGVVGLRLHLGTAAYGLPAGSELTLGLPNATPAAVRPQRTATRTIAAAPTATTMTRSPTPPALAASPLAILGFGADATPTAPTASDTPPGSSLGAQAVQIALQYQGIPYVWGGSTPQSGFDCSGLTRYVYAQLGVKLTHYAAAQWHEGTPVASKDVRPGDLVFFEPKLDGPGHVGIYLGGGYFLHAPHSGDVVKITSFGDQHYASMYMGAERLSS